MALTKAVREMRPAWRGFDRGKSLKYIEKNGVGFLKILREALMPVAVR